MKRSLLALTAALLTGTVAGAAFAHSHDRGDRALVETRGDLARTEANGDGERFRVAGDHRRDRHHDRKHRRHHDDHDDDDDDDDRRGGERTGRQPATGPTDPAAPVPDNGLFQGKARPKVEVN